MKRRKVMEVAKNQHLDKVTETRFIQQRLLNRPISGPVVCEKALETNTKLEGPEVFKASSGRIHKFDYCHGIRKLQIQGEPRSAGAETINVECYDYLCKNYFFIAKSNWG